MSGPSGDGVARTGSGQPADRMSPRLCFRVRPIFWRSARWYASMKSMEHTDRYQELVPVPLASVRLPVEVPLPPSFDPDRLETWPRTEGRLEFVRGRLTYMPPTGDYQLLTCADVLETLKKWRRSHRDFVVGGNEAGIRLGEDTRAADAAVWRKSDLPAFTGGLVHTPPVLAVEVAGRYDDEQLLRDKGRWYLDHGVAVVWLVFPGERRVVVMTAAGEETVGRGESMPTNSALPGLHPRVSQLFEQISE